MARSILERHCKSYFIIVIDGHEVKVGGYLKQQRESTMPTDVGDQKAHHNRRTSLESAYSPMYEMSSRASCAMVLMMVGTGAPMCGSAPDSPRRAAVSVTYRVQEGHV